MKYQVQPGKQGLQINEGTIADLTEKICISLWEDNLALILFFNACNCISNLCVVKFHPWPFWCA